MTHALTRRAVTVTWLAHLGPAAAQTLTIPAGTRAVFVEDQPRPQWAVADAAMVARISGNAHDAQYRYVWLPDEAMLPPDANAHS